jgi:negative regulator of sigma E activity
MDEITGKRLDKIDLMIAELKGEQNGVRSDIADLRGEMVDQFRQVDLRLSTEVREVAGMLRDLKAWLVERDDTKQRLAKLEEQVTQLLRQRPA